jgi:hypothetical protein
MTDKYWCVEGCGFVDANHRCEQWSQTIRIPAEAIELIRRECSDEVKTLKAYLAWALTYVETEHARGQNRPIEQGLLQLAKSAIMGEKE